MLVIELSYKQPMSVVEEHLAAHRSFLDAHYESGAFIASGPKNPRDGGIILAKISRSVAQSIIENDPFYLNDVADYAITEFDPVKSSEAFRKILDE